MAEENKIQMYLSSENVEAMSKDEKLGSFVIKYANEAYFKQDFEGVLKYCVLPSDNQGAANATDAFRFQMETTHAAQIKRITVSIEKIEKPTSHLNNRNLSIPVSVVVTYKLELSEGEIVDNVNIGLVEGQFKYALFDPANSKK